MQEGPLFESASAYFSLEKVVVFGHCLCDFVPHSKLNIKMALIAAHL